MMIGKFAIEQSSRISHFIMECNVQCTVFINGIYCWLKDYYIRLVFFLFFFPFLDNEHLWLLFCIDVSIHGTGVVDRPFSLLSPSLAASCLVQKRSAWL